MQFVVRVSRQTRTIVDQQIARLLGPRRTIVAVTVDRIVEVRDLLVLQVQTVSRIQVGHRVVGQITVEDWISNL